jgi:putative methyltransferase (TIGR04325 family)
MKRPAHNSHSALDALMRWAPPAAIDALRAVMKTSISFSRAYPSWERASRASSGYDAELILERVLTASRQVRDGLFACERDSVLFDEIQYSFPVIATMLRAALERQGVLSVVDIGGALGSSFRECKPFLGSGVTFLSWFVVEQQAFVEAGQREMQTEELKFSTSLKDAGNYAPIDVVLMSSVLQYLPSPSSTLDEVIGLEPRYIVLDRTITTDRPNDSAHVQRVPRYIYDATYPVWALSRQRILAHLGHSYELLSQYPSLPFPALSSIGGKLEGFIFKARKAQ